MNFERDDNYLFQTEFMKVVLMSAFMKEEWMSYGTDVVYCRTVS